MHQTLSARTVVSLVHRHRWRLNRAKIFGLPWKTLMTEGLVWVLKITESHLVSIEVNCTFPTGFRWDEFGAKTLIITDILVWWYFSYEWHYCPEPKPLLTYMLTYMAQILPSVTESVSLRRQEHCFNYYWLCTKILGHEE